MSGNRLSPMHGPLIRYDRSATAPRKEVAGVAERYTKKHVLSVPRSVQKKPMEEYWVFLPNRYGYRNVAASYVARNPEMVRKDGDRFVIRTDNRSYLAAITGVIHIGHGGHLCQGKETIEDYFDDGVDVIKASDVMQITGHQLQEKYEF